MQFSAVLNIFIVKTKLNSTFTTDLKRKENFSKNVHSYRVCSFNVGKMDAIIETSFFIFCDLLSCQPKSDSDVILCLQLLSIH